MLERILLVDVETTGLDPEKDVVVEVGAVAYWLPKASVLSTYSTLVWANGNPAEAINHIPASLIDRFGAKGDDAWSIVADMAVGCDAAVAHNAEFDRQFVPDGTIALPWIDTCNGVVWPMQTRPSSSLITLVLEHGIAVVDPHRALNDCMLLARLLTRCAELGHDIAALLSRGLRPSATFQALVSYDDRQLAKDAGFKWEAGTKRWLRTMAIDDVAALDFKTCRIEDDDTRPAFDRESR